MRQDFFTYAPQFKLLIAGNHKPRLRNADEAMRRRMHLVPFTVTIPEEERDRRLPDKLIDEHSGILSWAIQGCLEWQRLGLAPPSCVRDATSDYLSAQDPLSVWIEDCCVVEKTAWASSGALYSSYRFHAERAGERSETQRKFAERLEARGF